MQTMLITGASKGIGAHLAFHFAKTYQIYLHYNTSPDEAKATQAAIVKQGGKAKLIQANLSEKRGAEEIVKQVRKESSKLDVLINNAGFSGPKMPLEEVSWENQEEIFGVNVFSAMQLTSLCIPLLNQGDNPNVIFVSSLAVRDCPPHIAIYAAAKGAIEVFTRCYAKGLGPKIRVNAVAPGVIPTGIHRQFYATEAEKQEKALLEELKERAITKRLGSLEQIGWTVEYILKNRDLTGEILHVNGGIALS